MKIRVGTWVGIGLVLLGVAAVPWLPAWGQAFPGPFVNLTAGGARPPAAAPASGAWGEVIMAKRAWCVQKQPGASSSRSPPSRSSSSCPLAGHPERPDQPVVGRGDGDRRGPAR